MVVRFAQRYTALIHPLGAVAQVILPEHVRSLPATDRVHLHLQLPDAFVAEVARRRLERRRTAQRRLYLADQLWTQTCQQIRAEFCGLEARIAHIGAATDGPKNLRAVSLFFEPPHEGCFRLVRYLERRGLQQAQEERDRVALAAA